MYYRTSRFTWAQAIIDAMLNALDTATPAAMLTTPKVQLYTAGPTPTPGRAVADYTKAVFAGYADVALVLAGPGITGGTDRAMLASANFLAGAIVSPGESALGYIITDGAAAWYGGEAFPAPLSFGQPGDFLELDLILPLPAVFSPSVA